MANANIFIEIERYIRNKIAMNGGIFNREQIWNESIEWFVNNPVEFNSILNLIENEGSRFADDSTPSVAYGGGYADDSTPSVAFGSRIDDDSTPSVANYDEYTGNIMPEHMSSIAESPMGSDQVDSSPGGYSDFETDTPLQRTISFAPPPRR